MDIISSDISKSEQPHKSRLLGILFQKFNLITLLFQILVQGTVRGDAFKKNFIRTKMASFYHSWNVDSIIQGEIWDPRRGSYRRGRRWWNAYLLFYESVDEAINDAVQDISQGLSDMSVNSSNSESFCVPQVITFDLF